MKSLNPEIIRVLAQKLQKEQSTVKKDIYSLRKQYSQCTLNAVAQIYAQKNGTTIYKKLDKEDRQSMPHIEFKDKIQIEQKKPKIKESIVKYIDHPDQDYFTQGHIREFNRAYGKQCYTAALILSRKIVENLIIDILKKKFPEKQLQNKELYFDTKQGRFKDFSVILDNLHKKKSDFGTNVALVERLVTKAKNIKSEGNDKAHSWYHLVESKKEIDDLDIPQVIALIIQLERTII